MATTKKPDRVSVPVAGPLYRRAKKIANTLRGRPSTARLISGYVESGVAIDEALDEAKKGAAK